MILRRSGDSPLLNVEFEDGLRGCKNKMRELTSLRTHENCGMKREMLQVVLLAVVDERRVVRQSKAVESEVGLSSFCSITPCMYRWKGQRGPQPFHLGGDEAVTVTMLVVSLDDFPLTLTNNTLEGNTPTIVHTTYDPGFMAPILMECVRAHGGRCEFLNKLPSTRRKQGNTQSTIAPCAVAHWNGLPETQGTVVRLCGLMAP